MKVFIAHPMSSAREPAAVDRAVRMLRSTFAGRGWSVYPQRATALAELNDQVQRGNGRPILEANVESIVTSDLLVVLVADALEPSSIWIEIGIALARGVPIAILSGESTSLPFLVRAALDTHSAQGQSLLHRPVIMLPAIDLSAGDITRTDATQLVDRAIRAANLED